MGLSLSFIILLAVMVHGLTLHEEIRLIPTYVDLTVCQQFCIAGRLGWDIATDYSSWAGLSTCSTQTCICAPERQAETETMIEDCQKGFTSACAASTVEHDGAVSWVTAYCGWVSSVTTSTLSPTTPPASDIPPPTTVIVTPSLIPETTGATTFATTLTGNTQPSPSAASVGNIEAFRQLLKCSPCGKSSCSILNPTNMSDAMYSLAVGTPVANCRGDGTSSIKSTSGGLITIGESWSFDATIGFALLGLTVEGGPSWTRSKSISWSQYVEIEVKPGQMGVLTAVVQYQRITGSFKTDSNEPYRVISNQPVRIVSYGSEVVPCTSQFSGNLSSAFNCTSDSELSSSAQTWLTGHALSPCVLSSAFLVVFLVIYM